MWKILLPINGCLAWVSVAFPLFWPAGVTSVWRFERFETVNHFDSLIDSLWFTQTKLFKALNQLNCKMIHCWSVRSTTRWWPLLVITVEVQQKLRPNMLKTTFYKPIANTSLKVFFKKLYFSGSLYQQLPR